MGVASEAAAAGMRASAPEGGVMWSGATPLEGVASVVSSSPDGRGVRSVSGRTCVTG